jgi:DNA-directed RNA polymerase specialized sigma24 family protein
MLGDLVEQLMQPLDETGRRILSLRLQQHRVSEIVELVGSSTRTVERTLQRVRKRLSEMMGE